MEYTTASGALAMPAHYALVPQEEMVYLDGGALFNITTEQVIQFGVNVVVNGLMFLGGAFFSAGVAMVTNAFVGTTLKSGGKIMKDFFSSLNGSQWAILGVTGLLGGFYGLSLASYYYVQLIDPLVKAFQDAFGTPAVQTSEALPAAA